nr:hypothetical protein [Tanacetum cinerariifolium]
MLTQLRSVPADQLRSVPADQLRSVPADQLRSVPADQLRSVPADQLRSVPADQLRSVPADQLRSVPADQLRSIPADQLRSVPTVLMIFKERLMLIINWIKECKHKNKKSYLLQKRLHYFNNSKRETEQTTNTSSNEKDNVYLPKEHGRHQNKVGERKRKESMRRDGTRDHQEAKRSIVGIKSLLDPIEITTAHVCVNAAQLELVLLVNFNEKYTKCLLLMKAGFLDLEGGGWKKKNNNNNSNDSPINTVMESTDGDELNEVLGTSLAPKVVNEGWSLFVLLVNDLPIQHMVFPWESSSMNGLDDMLENGLWFIRNNPLILSKWHSEENLLTEDISTIPVWVKLHDVPVVTFSEDGLSAIATKLVWIPLQ